jgi:hypothetical protein
LTRPHRPFTYANVVSTLALFLVLGGGAAFAAVQLGAESVGTRELKKNAVTKAKIKTGAVGSPEIAAGAVGSSDLADDAVGAAKLGDGSVGAGKLGEGAVTTDKLGDSAVTTAKLADGSVTAQKLEPGALAIGPSIVHQVRSAVTLALPPVTAQTHPIPYPLENAVYTQPLGEDDLYLASVKFHIPASCINVRRATARLFIDPVIDAQPFGQASFTDDGNGDKTVTIQVRSGEFGHGPSTIAPDVPTTHTFSMELVNASCNGVANVRSGITVTQAKIDVIGIR